MSRHGLVAAGVASVMLLSTVGCGSAQPVTSVRSFTPHAAAAGTCPARMPADVWRLLASRYGEDDDGDGKPDEIVLPAGVSWCDAMAHAAPACREEDGSGQHGLCVWDASSQGNHLGSSVTVYRDGVTLWRTGR